MIRNPTRVPDSRRERSVAAQVAALSDRLEASERRHRQLHNTVAALGREIGVSVGAPCSHCAESYTLVKDGCMSCPRCGHRRSL